MGKRMMHQMAAIDKTIVVDATNKRKLKRMRGQGPITCHSFHKSKRDNSGDNKVWRPTETERFYKILKYSGLNFTYMEIVYNKAQIKVNLEDVKKEQKIKQIEEEKKKKMINLAESSDEDSN